MSKNIFVCLILAITSGLALAETVRLENATEPSVFLLNDPAAFSVVTEAATDNGNSTDITLPVSAFIAVKSDNGAGLNSEEFYIFSGTELSTIAGVGLVRLTLIVETSNTANGDRFLYVAARDSSDTDFQIVARFSGDAFDDSFNDTITVDFSLVTFCAITALPCASIEATDTPGSTFNNLFYYFLNEADFGDGSGDVGINPADPGNNNGVFVKYNFSNNVNNSTVVSIDNIEIGDGQLKVKYSGTVISDFKDVIVFIHTGAVNGAIAPINTIATGSIDPDSFPPSSKAEITIRGLNNAEPFSFSLAFVNKYNFATNLSIGQTATPQSIQVFLESQACYLLSAGFQKPHYVLDYFREFRDEILLSYSWGQKFVEFYYKSAPQFTPYILDNPILAGVIKVLAYTAYAMFHLWYWCLLLISSFTLFVVARLIVIKGRQRVFTSS